jgi:hypothetical protein
MNVYTQELKSLLCHQRFSGCRWKTGHLNLNGSSEYITWASETIPNMKDQCESKICHHNNAKLYSYSEYMCFTNATLWISLPQ